MDGLLNVYPESRRFRTQARESTSNGTTTLSNSTERIDSLPSNIGSDTAAIIEQLDAYTELKGQKQRLTAAKKIFKKLTRSYLDKRAPPDPESMRELWEYKDVLDLKTVFTWRDEVGIRRGVLYENGKIEFDKWPVPPHEDIFDIFENVFKRQFVLPWMNQNNRIPTFRGKHNQGKNV
jgi:hypothetical protein